MRVRLQQARRSRGRFLRRSANRGNGAGYRAAGLTGRRRRRTTADIISTFLAPGSWYTRWSSDNRMRYRFPDSLRESLTVLTWQVWLLGRCIDAVIPRWRGLQLPPTVLATRRSTIARHCCSRPAGCQWRGHANERCRARGEILARGDSKRVGQQGAEPVGKSIGAFGTVRMKRRRATDWSG